MMRSPMRCVQATEAEIETLCRMMQSLPGGSDAAALVSALWRENRALRARLAIAGLPLRACGGSTALSGTATPGARQTGNGTQSCDAA